MTGLSMVPLVLAFAAALAVAIVATYAVRALAPRFGLVDRPDGRRRLHAEPIPRAGGIAVYLAFTLVGAIGAWLSSQHVLPGEHTRAGMAVLLGAAAIFAIGLWDDVRGLSARTKFLLEIGIAAALYFSGVAFHALSIPGHGSVILPHLVSFPLTLLWIVGITNAFNLIDGADGVAAGAAVFAAGAMALVSAATGQAGAALAALTLAGATLGFLFFNFPPASIFLGDCGSLFIGFVLACLGLLTAQTASTMMAVAIPVVSLGLPILDTALAMVRRFLRHEPIFNPDRGHIHHRLRDLGGSPRTVALLLYAVSAGFALLSLLLVDPARSTVGALFVVAGIVVLIGVQRLRIPELEELRRIVRRGLVQREAIAYNVAMAEAVRRVREAAEPGAILRALRDALEAGEFHRAELWVDRDLAGPLLDAELMAREARSAVWRWGDQFEHVREWEFRLVLRNDHDAPIGRLSLWHPSDAPHVLTNLQLIGGELQPELGDALLRLSLAAPAPAPTRLAVGAIAGSRLVHE